MTTKSEINERVKREVEMELKKSRLESTAETIVKLAGVLGQGAWTSTECLPPILIEIALSLAVIADELRDDATEGQQTHCCEACGHFDTCAGKGRGE